MAHIQRTQLIQIQDPTHGCRLGQLVGQFPTEHIVSSSTKIIDLTAIDESKFRNFQALLDVAHLAGESISSIVHKGIESANTLKHYPASILENRPSHQAPHLIAPITPYEVWGAGITYKRSREAREVETKSKGIYERVYDATRPEVFFKTTGIRVIGPYAPVGMRKDSSWSVPEPELALILGYGDPPEIIGLTIGNDMSARDIEGENPLYLPQAKIFKQCCVLGPMIVPIEEIPDPYSLPISLTIIRAGTKVFHGTTSTSDMKRRFKELVDYLALSNTIVPGTAFVTGTGIVPPDDFSCQEGDLVRITIGGLGILENPVVKV